MVAVELEPTEADARPTLAVVAADAKTAGTLQAHARAAEQRLAHAAIRGMLIGMPACAVVWIAIVGLGLAIGSADWDVLPAFGTAAVVGMFAGAFFGGWAGVTLTAHALDEAEVEITRH